MLKEIIHLAPILIFGFLAIIIFLPLALLFYPIFWFKSKRQKTEYQKFLESWKGNISFVTTIEVKD